MRRIWVASLLAGTALLSAPALAAAQKAGAGRQQSDPRIIALEAQLRDVERQLAEIKGAKAEQPDTARRFWI